MSGTPQSEAELDPRPGLLTLLLWAAPPSQASIKLHAQHKNGSFHVLSPFDLSCFEIPWGNSEIRVNISGYLEGLGYHFQPTSVEHLQQACSELVPGQRLPSFLDCADERRVLTPLRDVRGEKVPIQVRSESESAYLCPLS